MRASKLKLRLTLELKLMNSKSKAKNKAPDDDIILAASSLVGLAKTDINTVYLESRNHSQLSLFEHLFHVTNQLTTQLQHQLQKSMVIEHTTNTHDLVGQINQVFTNQASINTLHSSIAKQNHFANMAVFAKTRQLTGIIARGKNQMVSLSHAIVMLKDTIAALNTDVEVQRVEGIRVLFSRTT
jgi:hypothetical protein